MKLQVFYWVRGHSHDDLVEVSKKSVLKAYGRENVEINVTRDDTEQPAMLANVAAQLAFLHDRPNARVLFLDADTIVLKPIYWADADLVVTWRDKVNGEANEISALMPYNYGVVGALAGPKSIEAWIWMYQRIGRMAERYQKWYGNQLALAELAGAPPKSSEQRGVIKIPWEMINPQYVNYLDIAKLPCEVFNYTPESLDEDVSAKYVLHFKGGRKALMMQYAEKLHL